MDAAQLQQLLDAVNAGNQQLQQAIVAAQPAPQPQPQPAPFALTPGRANATTPIDYTDPIGIKVWQEATAALDFEFDVDSAGLNQFCEKLMERASQSTS